MSNLQLISDTLRSPKTLKRLGLALSLDINKEQDARIIQEYGSSVLMEIEKTVGDDKKDLSICTPDSVVQCMIDSAKFGIKIDGRQHAHLVKYGKKATLQIGYRGFIAKIRDIIPSSDINVFPVYEGDDLKISSHNGFDSYSYNKSNPFAEEKDLTGVVGILYYKKEGKEFQRVLAISKNDIDKIKGCAKQTFIWNKWYIEKAKVAAIKRLCKITFAEISEIQKLIEYDNKSNFEMKDNAPEIDQKAQLDEFTQKELENKSDDNKKNAQTLENMNPNFDLTYGGQFNPETGEIFEKNTEKTNDE